MEWKVVYVGSADDETQDQELDSVLVGPDAVGSYRFVFQADAPDPSRIPPEDLLGVTVVLLTCSYRGQEFLRVGYYVNNEYDNEELKENPPSVPMIDRIERSILADKPRVTKFQIRWDDAGAAETMATGCLRRRRHHSRTSAALRCKRLIRHTPRAVAWACLRPCQA